ncbi:MAG TPA: M23 family metallopeptidase [Symbiobacteriaceae bacterium]|nr:M23 family metallopeptidase [Symbiobacteriaceae bacterium]
MKLLIRLGCLGVIGLFASFLAVVMAVATTFAGQGAGSPAPAVGGLLWPTHGRITDGFGIRVNPFPPHNEEGHWGVDIAAEAGTPVLAATAGEILSTAWAGGYGNLVILLGPGRLVTYYGHLSGFAVKRGQTVARGQVIGFVGSTGRSTAPHLHLEVRPYGRNPVDPLLYLGNPQVGPHTESAP